MLGKMGRRPAATPAPLDITVVTLQAAQIQRRKVRSRSETWAESSRAGWESLVMPMSFAFEPVKVTARPEGRRQGESLLGPRRKQK
jgi:hypothetical protein